MAVEELYGDYDNNDDYEDDEPLDCCPKCGRDYDEIGADFQYCKACGWDAENKKWDNPMEIIFDKTDREEFETVAKYLQGKYDDLGKRKKETEDKPKQLLQMINTIERALALANER